jgi:hypothetical protein
MPEDTTPTLADPAPRSELVIRGHPPLAERPDHSASQGAVYFRQLRRRPLARTAELLEFVPGLMATQHAGGGKANQYYLRGFNLDHGTDFAVWLDGVPLNLPTHGHGQGYTDLNPLIPELIDKLTFQKGVYAAEYGDSSSAGGAQLHQARALQSPLMVAELGQFGRGRGLWADSLRGPLGTLLYALEVMHHDGPWQIGDGFLRLNGVVSAEAELGAHHLRLAARAYRGSWHSTDQVAESAISQGLIGRFAGLDNTTGGVASRASLQLDWRRQDGPQQSAATVYAVATKMDLFSNFTYFLTDPLAGDQFEQTDDRWTLGVTARHTVQAHLAGLAWQNSAGLQLRSDIIRNGLYQTRERVRQPKALADGTVLAATTRQDDILQSSAGVWGESQVQIREDFLAVLGLRGDAVLFDVASQLSQNSGQRSAAIASPKLTLRWTPTPWLQFFAQAGLGFHSNDGRGVLTRRDPVTSEPVQAADPLVRTRGGEMGLRAEVGGYGQSTLALWWLDADSELVFVGDAGTTEAGRPSRRFGLEWTHHLHLWEYLRGEVEIAWSDASFRDEARDEASGQLVGQAIPGAVRGVAAAAMTWQPAVGPQLGVRLRWFGERPLLEDQSIIAESTALLGAHMGWRWPKGWQVLLTGWNLLNRRDADIAYAYESRVTPSSPALLQRHLHPVEPLQLRLELSKGW